MAATIKGAPLYAVTVLSHDAKAQTSRLIYYETLERHGPTGLDAGHWICVSVTRTHTNEPA